LKKKKRKKNPAHDKKGRKAHNPCWGQVIQKRKKEHNQKRKEKGGPSPLPSRKGLPKGGKGGVVVEGEGKRNFQQK